MTKALVKVFVKNFEDTENPQVRTSYGVLASLVGILCNILLFIMKFTIGITIRSISVMADAFNNLSDAASSVVSFVGVKLANRPADKEHPFGHGRYEYIAALVVAFLVFQVGLSCMKSSISKIIHPETVEFQPLLVGILSVSVLLKLWLGIFNRKLGNRINSTVMKATSADAFGDVLITTVTILSIILGNYMGWNIDGYMGIGVSCFIFYAGFSIARETLEPLIGEAVTPELYQQITDFVESYEGIVGSHDLIVHNYGPSHIMATIHGEVPKDVDIEVAHETIDKIERDAARDLGIFLVIHMDPIEVNNPLVSQLRKKLKEMVMEFEPNSSIHDFRMVSGEQQSNLIFDLVVPYGYKREKQLMEFVNKRVRNEDATYQCVITVEHSYVKVEKK